MNNLRQRVLLELEELARTNFIRIVIRAFRKRSHLCVSKTVKDMLSWIHFIYIFICSM